MIKEGVDFNGVQPETIMGMLVVDRIMEEEGHIRCVTSILDGKHMAGSQHYAGLAFDQRTWADKSGNQLPMKEKLRLAELFKLYLGDSWDVVVEDTHIHCELDSKV